MRLQIAMDDGDTGHLLEVASKIHDVIDIFEVGTPVIMLDGCHAVKAVKDAYPRMCVLADSKIMDGGALECLYLCKAGADIVTVMAVSDNATITEVIETAHAYGRKVMVDLMNVTDIPARSRELVELGADYVAVHTAFDVQKLGRTPLGDLRELVGAINPSKAVGAGGVKQSTIADYVALRPGIIVAGAALYGAPDIRKAVIDMEEALD